MSNRPPSLATSDAGQPADVAVAVENARPRVAALLRDAGGIRQRRPARIIVVSNNATIRQLVVGILHRIGYAVVEADAGPAAQQLARRSGPFDLVLTDPGFEIKPGLDLIRWFREEFPQTHVLMTRGSLGELNAILCEADDIAMLVRPFTAEQLGAAVCKLLARDGVRRRGIVRRYDLTDTVADLAGEQVEDFR